MQVMKTMARQGDTLTINQAYGKLKEATRKRLFNIKKAVQVAFKTEQRIPLAYGEVSGHAHAIYTEGTAELWVSSDVQETLKHLNVIGDAVVQHEEHEAFKVAEGKNAVLIQNEYRLEKIRRVAD